jgi:hypothetical protein
MQTVSLVDMALVDLVMEPEASDSLRWMVAFTELTELKGSADKTLLLV